MSSDGPSASPGAPALRPCGPAALRPPPRAFRKLCARTGWFRILATRCRYPWTVPIHSTPSGPGQHQDSGTAPPRSEAVPATGAPGKAAPLLVPAVLEDMRSDFDDPAVVNRFAHDFCSTLGGKIDRLDVRLRGGDAMGAADAVLSVTTSSAMVGAVRLTQAALRMQRLIAADDLDEALHSLPLLRACAADTVAALGRSYPVGSAGAAP